MNIQPTSFGQISYAERGTGAPLVLLHANAHDHRDFDPVVDELSQRYRTIAVDWPLHGESTWDRPADELTGSVLADVLREFVTALDLPPAVYVGCSMGGFAAARLAIDEPERVAGLILVNSGGFTPRNPLTWMFCRTMGSERISRRVMPRFVDAYMRSTSDHDALVTERVKAHLATPTGARTAAGMWRSFAAPSYDLRDEAPALTAPTLLLWGAKDPTLGRPAAKATAKALPEAELVLMETGHLPFSSDLAMFLTHAEPFIAAHARPQVAPERPIRAR